MREGLANLLVSHGMTRCRDSGRSMSLNVVRKVVLCMTIGWVRFDSFPDYRINAMYPLVVGTTQLLLRKLGEYVGSTN